MPNDNNLRLNSVFRALSDPTRRAIVQRLTAAPTSVSEIARPLGMTLPAVMQHLQVLEDSGLVRSSKQGRVRTCCIDQRALMSAEKWIADRRQSWESRLDLLGEYLACAPEMEKKRKKS